MPYAALICPCSSQAPRPPPASLEASSNVCLKENRAAYASSTAEPEAATLTHALQHIAPDGDTCRPAVLRREALPSTPPNPLLKPKVPSLRGERS